MTKASGYYTCYSSVFGNFESAWAPLRQDVRVSTVLISDRQGSKAAWLELYSPPCDFGSPRLNNRYHKMLHYQSFAPEGLSVYVDANVRPVSNLLPLFEAFQQSGADIGMYRHYARTSVRQEAQACLARNKVANPDSLAEELSFYEDSGFPDTGGMWEGSVIFKRHSSSALQTAMEEWWELYSRFQTRDQFSLPFVIWKHDLKVFDLDDHSPGREHYFVRLQHSQSGLRNRLARYLQARAPENSFWSALHRAGQTFAGSHTAKE